MELDHWLVMPAQVAARVERWQHEHPDLITVDTIRQHTGYPVYAITVGENAAAGAGTRPAAWFDVAHAHEPACTAAVMDFLERLLTGHDLAGRPATFDSRAARRRLTLTFNPDANPGGRAWAPCLWWDGSRYNNDEFWQFMRGLDADGRTPWRRVARWSLRDEQPLRRGIVYEQLNEHEFVEPNRDPGSSLVRLFRQLDARHRYARALHLHQTEFANSLHNCEVYLPVLQRELTEQLQAENRAWGRAIVERWRAGGASPVLEPWDFPYLDDPVQVGWFRECWGDLQARSPDLIVEVQNNNPRTPPAVQLDLVSQAIQATVERMLELA